MSRARITDEGICAIVNGGLLSMELASQERMDELKQSLDRALNCWDKAPQWLVDLHDALSDMRDLNRTVQS